MTESNGYISVLLDWGGNDRAISANGKYRTASPERKSSLVPINSLMNTGRDKGAGRKAALPGLVRERIDAFNRSEYARLLGMEVTEVWDGGARVVMEPRGKGNPYGVAHGGAIFSVADQAFGIAANCGPVPQVAVSAQIEYIAPSAGRLEAVAERVADDGRHSIYRVTVCEGDRLVAIFTGVGIASAAVSRSGRDRLE